VSNDPAIQDMLAHGWAALESMQRFDAWAATQGDLEDDEDDEDDDATVYFGLPPPGPFGGPPPPPGVASLYSAIRGAWHYKQTHAGRTAHAQASMTEPPNLAPLTFPAPDLAGSMHLRKRQLEQAEEHLHDLQRSRSTPLLLPGPPTDSTGGAGAAEAGTKRKKTAS